MVHDQMETAEDERLQQQPIVADDGADFNAAIGGGGGGRQHEQRPPAKVMPHVHAQHAAAAAAPAKTHVIGTHATQGHPATAQHGNPVPPSSRPLVHAHVPHLSAGITASAAASPSASSSPHSGHILPIPYLHQPPLFKDKIPYLASNASPSQRDGLSSDDEFLLRAHTCVFMGSIGQRLKLGQLALATASVFLQVFFTHYSFKAFDRLEIACTCLFLAGKVEERRVRVDNVLGAYFTDKESEERKMAAAAGVRFEPRPKPLVDSPEWDALRTRVYEFEALLLDAIEYNFDILHPYSFLRKFLKEYIYSSVYCKESQ
jgi:hypothetical protein